ncbi:MAG: hypothetical protein AMXMBFR66_35460 [Pseudomonadota bacterium]|nr:hypothetical protein [Rubrivivax sp.]NLZ41791.1 hypothetical protein [Comamonadaceae bacterium]
MALGAEIAAHAARLVVEEGMEYAAAKHKAARDRQRRGGGRCELPSNEEVEDQVRTHLALFHAEEQPAELQALRRLAREWMRRLADLRPHLAGAVWRGTATRRSAVLLDLYCDDPKAAELALLDAGVRYEVGTLARAGSAPLPLLTVQVASRALGENVPLVLVLHDRDAQRGALKPDARGRSWRGDLVALERLLAAEAAP